MKTQKLSYLERSTSGVHFSGVVTAGVIYIYIYKHKMIIIIIINNNNLFIYLFIICNSGRESDFILASLGHSHITQQPLTFLSLLLFFFFNLTWANPNPTIFTQLLLLLFQIGFHFTCFGNKFEGCGRCFFSVQMLRIS